MFWQPRYSFWLRSPPIPSNQLYDSIDIGIAKWGCLFCRFNCSVFSQVILAPSPAPGGGVIEARFACSISLEPQASRFIEKRRLIDFTEMELNSVQLSLRFTVLPLLLSDKLAAFHIYCDQEPSRTRKCTSTRSQCPWLRTFGWERKYKNTVLAGTYKCM